MLNYLLLQESSSAAGGNLVFFLILIAATFFFIIRPQQRKQKTQKVFTTELAVGDKIVTTGGVYGKILTLDEISAQIEVDKGTRLKILRASISNEYTAFLRKTEAEDQEAKLVESDS